MGHLGPGAFLSYFLLHQAFFGKKKLEQIGLGKAAISIKYRSEPQIFLLQMFWTHHPGVGKWEQIRLGTAAISYQAVLANGKQIGLGKITNRAKWANQGKLSPSVKFNLETLSSVWPSL